MATVCLLGDVIDFNFFSCHKVGRFAIVQTDMNEPWHFEEFHATIQMPNEPGMIDPGRGLVDKRRTIGFRAY